MKIARFTAALAALLLAIGLLASPASAQDYNGGTVDTVDTAEVAPQTERRGGAEVQGQQAARPVTASSGALPYTGGDSAPIAQIGLGLLAAGALVTLVVRQRSRADA